MSPVTAPGAQDIADLDVQTEDTPLDGETSAEYGSTRVMPPPDLPRSDDAPVPVPVGMDWRLFAAVIGLMTMGVVMAFSASVFVALHQHNGNETYFLTRHIGHISVALVMMMVGIHTPYQVWRKAAYPILFLCILMLVALMVLPQTPNPIACADTVNKATRWLVLFKIRLQPSELVKFAFVLYLAKSLTKKAASNAMESFTVGFLPHLLVWGLVFLMCMWQPDLGTGIVLAVLVFAMTFIAGLNKIYLVSLGAVGLSGLMAIVLISPMRFKRLVAFLNPELYRDGAGFQLFNGRLAIATGGWFGNGLGLSRQKLGFVPEAHTDFILSIIAEELGLVGVALIALTFVYILHRGTRIALRGRDEFGRLLATGVTVLLGTQAAINFGVVMGTLPTKGLTLPFVSHGGSSLMALSLAVGVLLNVGRGGNPDHDIQLPAMPRLPWLRRTRNGVPANVRTGNTRVTRVTTTGGTP
jgi:cell division protein FtsW